MIFKLIGNLVIASVAFQMVPGSWTPVVADPAAASNEIIRGEVSWASSLPEAGDIAITALPDAEPVKQPVKNNENSLGVKTTASNIIAVDLKTGKILFEKNGDEARPIASITKLMTVLVLMENNPGWDEVITIRNVISVGNNSFYEGEKVKLIDLFNAALVGSDNTAARNLAYATGMTMEDFVQAMNDKAAELGLAKANFFDPVGLDPKNVASPLDVVKILRAAIGYEEVTRATQKRAYEFKSVSGKNHYIKSTDDLLAGFINKPPYKIHAAKTGSLLAAGYCLVMAVENQGNVVLIASLNSKNDFYRFQDVKSLAYWVFENYDWPAD